MAIESYRAAEKQLASEARAEQYPGLETAIGVMRKIAGLSGFEFTRFEDLSLNAIRKNSQGNLHYLFESLVQDLERIDLKVEAFESAGKIECEALNGLISEAVARAAESKNKDRVRRIARILANAFRSGPKQHYELERELIDTAIQISESDAHIVGVMLKHQGAAVKAGSGIADINVASDTWKQMQETNKEFRDPHIHVSCARLQSQGLIIRMDRKTSALDLATNAYSLTTFGVQFCEWCLQEPQC
jgi:hypothetical protein